MKNVLNSVVFAVFLVLGACAKDSGGGDQTIATVPSACAAGQVNSQFGCIPQGGCPVNFGLYNNQCVPATDTATAYGNCVAGQVYTQQGCLAQANCPVNFGMAPNGQCIPAYNVGYNGGYNGGYYYNNGGAYNSYYYQYRNYPTGYYGGGYYGYPTGYYGGAGIGVSGGIYIGGGIRAGVPGMYYGY
jgi:hypothetical protein